MAVAAHDDASKNLSRNEKVKNELEDLAKAAEMDSKTEADFDEKSKVCWK